MKNVCFQDDKVVLSSQQSIENDIILPDYYADISKILSCGISTFEEAICISDDNISLPAGAEYNIIYLGIDSKLYCYCGEIKYTKYFKYNNLGEKTHLSAEQKIISHHCKAIGPKRLELKGSIISNIIVNSEEELSVVSSENEDLLELKNIIVNNITFLRSNNKRISVTDSFNFENNNETVNFIISKDAKLRINEIKSIQNKAFIKGVAEVNVFYINCNGNIGNKSFSLPFSEVVDVTGLSENDVCKLENISLKTLVDIKNAEDNKTYFNISSDITFDVTCDRAEEICFCEDAYSRFYRTQLKCTERKIITDCEYINRTVNLTEYIDCYNSDGYTVIHSCIDNLKIIPEISDERIKIICIGSIKVLLKNQEGKFIFSEKSINSECSEIQINSTSDFDVLNSLILSSAAVLSPGNKIKFVADINFEGRINYFHKVKLITEITENCSDKETEKSIIIYFPDKNEDLWNIAKNNYSSLANIKKFNECSAEVSDIPYVFPNF